MTPAVAWILLGVLLFTVGMARRALQAVWVSLAALLTAAASLGVEELWVQAILFVVLWLFLGIVLRRWSLSAGTENQRRVQGAHRRYG